MKASVCVDRRQGAGGSLGWAGRLGRLCSTGLAACVLAGVLGCAGEGGSLFKLGSADRGGAKDHSYWPGEGGGEARSSGVSEGVWSIRPVSMRVYPSTRFTLQDGRSVLEARVEFFDAAGDSVKAVGNVRIELFLAPRLNVDALGQRLYEWNVPMLTLAQNRVHFDPVTRGYLFRLELDKPQPPDRDVIARVTLIPPAGPRLEARMTLNSGQRVGSADAKPGDDLP